jgi:inorganic pyrophosphatase
MLDGGEDDDKLVVVPVTPVDPTYEGVATLDDLPPMQLERIEAFFEVYKELPEPAKEVELGGWEGPEAAREIIRTGIIAGQAG